MLTVLCIAIANKCTVWKYWERCDLCTAVRSEKLCVVLPSKRMSDLVLFLWGGLQFEQADPKAQVPSHHPGSPTPDGALAKNTRQGGQGGPDPLIPAGLTGIKSVCKDPKLRLKVHPQMRQLRDTLYSGMLAPFPPQLPHLLSSGGYISVS